MRVCRTGLRATLRLRLFLKFCLRENLLSAFANRFELRCGPKLLMLLYYKICPCCNKCCQKFILFFFKQVQKKVGPRTLNEYTIYFLICQYWCFEFLNINIESSKLPPCKIPELKAEPNLHNIFRRHPGNTYSTVYHINSVAICYNSA